MKTLSSEDTLTTALIDAWNAGPENPAIYYFDTRWTYADMMDRVEHLAGGLSNMGIEPGDRVGIMLQNMPAAVAAYLATWALGAAAVPLNVMFRADELGYHLRDSRAKCLIMLSTVTGYLADLPPLPDLKHVIVVDDREDFQGEAPAWLPPKSASGIRPGVVDYHTLLDASPLSHSSWHEGHADDMALITYTSGTTGSPKGAVNTHRNMVHNVIVYQSMARLNDDTVNIAFAPLFHITGVVAGLAVSVGLGLPMILLYRFDPRVAVEAIARKRASFTVGAITTYLGILALEDLRQYDLSSFTQAYSGGAPVPEATVNAFEEQTGVYIHNVYGLTESSNGLIMVPNGIRSPIDPESGALSIGRAGPNISVTVLDPNDPTQLSPPNSVGELALKGPSIIAKYWDKPDETERAFHDGWFLTGDVARLDEEGWIYLVDRKKDVIISAGNKIWPRDVEDALYKHPGVLEAVVVGLPDPYRGEAVTAFVVRKPEFTLLAEADLLNFLRERLAVYKVPKSIRWVDSIPKTATGKFLRRAFRTGEIVDEIPS